MYSARVGKPNKKKKKERKPNLGNNVQNKAFEIYSKQLLALTRLLELYKKGKHTFGERYTCPLCTYFNLKSEDSSRMLCPRCPWVTNTGKTCLESSWVQKQINKRTWARQIQIRIWISKTKKLMEIALW